MNKRHIIEHARGYLELLSQGVDPISMKIVNDDSVVSEPRIQKCFAFVAEILAEVLDKGAVADLTPDEEGDLPANDDLRYELVIKKRPFQLSQEQRDQFQFDEAPVTPRVFVGQINRLIDSQSMEKLSVKSINAWLISRGYISETKQPATINRTVLKPTLKAAAIGITEEETTDKKTGQQKQQLVLSPAAQRFLLVNLDEMIADS